LLAHARGRVLEIGVGAGLSFPYYPPMRPDGQLLFSEHVRSEDPKRARWQDRLEPIWGVVANGCHPNRRTLDAIRDAGFDVGDVEQRELPDVPALVRPYVSGRALVRG